MIKINIKISVIIPIYNVEKYLAECLDSVVNQTLKDIEIICVNDGSTDSCSKIIDRYANKYNNIKVITQKNAGLSAARNNGYNIAKGKYIYFLDSDDYLKDLNALNIIFEECEKENLDIALINSYASCEDKNIGTDFIINTSKHLGTNVMSGEEAFNVLIENAFYYPAVWLKVYKREFLENLNIIFYEGIIYEDLLYSIICEINAKRVKHIGKLIHIYRIRNGSIMNTGVSPKSIDGYYISAKELYKFLSELSIYNKSEKTIKNLRLFTKDIYKQSIFCCDILGSLDKRKVIVSNIDKSLIDISIDIMINTPTLYYNSNK